MERSFPSLVILIMIVLSNFAISTAPDKNRTRDPSRDMWILGDAALIQTAKINGWQGEGTEADPVIIKDLNITGDAYQGSFLKLENIGLSFSIINCSFRGSTSSNGGGIYLLNSSGDIQDCRVNGGGFGVRLTGASNMTVAGGHYSDGQFGIVLEGCTNITVDNNTCSDNMDGISLLMSEDCWVMNNTLIANSDTGSNADDSENLIFSGNSYRDNDFGLLVTRTSSVRIMENFFRNQDDHHIRIDASDHVLIHGNEALDYGDGLHLSGATNNVTAINNTLTDNGEYGIYIDNGCFDNIFYGNMMTGCSFFIEPELDIIQRQIIPQNNTVNGRRVYHYHDIKDSRINISFDAGQIILGRVNDLTVYGCNLSDGTIGIEMVDCSDITIKRCNISDNFYYGILGKTLYGRNTIEVCDLTNCYEGIRLIESRINMVSNRIMQNEVGIHTSNSQQDIGIYYNFINGNKYGIIIEDSSEISSSGASVYHNTISNNEEFGVLMDNEFFTIKDNRFNNEKTALEINGYHNVVKNNQFMDCQIGTKVGWYSGSSWVSNNTYDNCSKSIMVTSSKIIPGESTIAGNRIFNSSENGIILLSTCTVEIMDNLIVNSGSHGIELYQSYWVGMGGNELVNCSFHITGDSPYNFVQITFNEGNTVNGKPVYYFRSMQDRVLSFPEPPGQLIIANSSNVIVENISFSHGGNGILAGFVERTRIVNCSFSDLVIGLEMENCDNVLVKNCSFKDGDIGLRTLECDRIELNDLSFNNVSETCIDMRFTERSKVIDCGLEYCGQTGISLYVTHDTEVTYNVIRNMTTGLRLWGSGSRISENLFLWNSGPAIIIEKGAYSNTITSNCFKFNNGTKPGVPNSSFDPQVRNEESSTIIKRNYWSSWFTYGDRDEDGFLDEPYWVGPGLNNKDMEPLIFPPQSILPPPINLSSKLVKVNSSFLVELTFDESAHPKRFPIYWTVNHFLPGTDISSQYLDEYIYYNYTGEKKKDLYPPPSDGTNHTFALWSEGIAGRSSIVYNEFPSSGEAPFIRIISPSNGSYINRSEVQVVWDAASNSGGELLEYIVELNGNRTSYWEPLNRFNATLVEGENLIRIEVMDMYGNRAEDLVHINVDTIPPSFFIIGGGFMTNPVQIRWIFNNSEDETLRMWWRHPDQEWSEIDPLERSLDLTLPQGDQKIELMTHDLAGNVFTRSVDLFVDDDPPYVLSWGPSATDWHPNDKIWILFSEEMDPNSIDIKIPRMNFTFEFVNESFIWITPSNILDHDAVYLVMVSGSDIAGNEMLPYTFLFSTGNGQDVSTLGDLIILVVDMEGRPIKGARATIFPQNIVKVDNQGSGIEYDNLEAGDYELLVEAEGYVPRSFSVTIQRGATISKVVYLEKERKDEPKILPILALAVSFVIFITAFLAAIFLINGKRAYPEE